MSGVPITLSNLANLQNDTSATNTINANSTSITNAFGSAFYRQGDQMQGNIDMNSNHIYNLPAPATQTEPIRVIDAANLTAGGTINVITRQTWPTPQDYGAVGDGVHDDTSAWQQLLNSGSDTVYVPAGTYAVNNLNVPIGVSNILGDGDLQYNGGSGGATFILSNFQWDINIEGLVFDNTPVNGSFAIEVKIQTASSKEIKINKCKFLGGDTSIYLNDLSAGLYSFDYIRVYNCIFQNQINGCINCNGRTSHTVIENNAMVGTGISFFHTIYFDPQASVNQDLKIINNEIFNTNTGASAILVRNVTGGRISGNQLAIGTGGTAGISAQASRGQTLTATEISDNVIYSIFSTSQGDGIQVGNIDTNVGSFVSDVLVTGNLIKQVGFSGISLFTNGSNFAQLVNISNNQIVNPGRSLVVPAIHLCPLIGGGTIQHCEVTGNVIDNTIDVNTNFAISLESNTTLCKTFFNVATVVSGNAYFDAGVGNTSDEGAAAFTRTYSNGVDVNVYVNPSTGNDSTGDGSAGNPWRTINFAYYTAASRYDGSSDAHLLVNLANGFYSGSGQQVNVQAGTVGFTHVYFLGNNGSPGSVVFDGGGNTVFSTNPGSSGFINIEGLQIQNAGNAIYVPGGLVQISNIIFTNCSVCVSMNTGGAMQCTGAMTFSGNNGTGIAVARGGSFDLAGHTVTFSGSTFSTWFIVGDAGGICNWSQAVVNGTTNAPKFFIYGGSTLRAYMFDGSGDLFPADMPGNFGTARLGGGWFNNLLGVDSINQTAGHAAQLPTSLASFGMRSFVTDATSTTFGTVVAGGGGNHVPVYWDGSNWRIG